MSEVETQPTAEDHVCACGCQENAPPGGFNFRLLSVVLALALAGALIVLAISYQEMQLLREQNDMARQEIRTLAKRVDKRKE